MFILIEDVPNKEADLMERLINPLNLKNSCLLGIVVGTLNSQILLRN